MKRSFLLLCAAALLKTVKADDFTVFVTVTADSCSPSTPAAHSLAVNSAASTYPVVPVDGSGQSPSSSPKPAVVTSSRPATSSAPATSSEAPPAPAAAAPKTEAEAPCVDKHTVNVTRTVTATAEAPKSPTAAAADTTRVVPSVHTSVSVDSTTTDFITITDWVTLKPTENVVEVTPTSTVFRTTVITKTVTGADGRVTVVTQQTPVPQTNAAADPSSSSFGGYNTTGSVVTSGVAAKSNAVANGTANATALTTSAPSTLSTSTTLNSTITSAPPAASAAALNASASECTADESTTTQLITISGNSTATANSSAPVTATPLASSTAAAAGVPMQRRDGGHLNLDLAAQYENVIYPTSIKTISLFQGPSIQYDNALPTNVLQELEAVGRLL